MMLTRGVHHFCHLGVPELDLDLCDGQVGLVGLQHHQTWLPEHAFGLLDLVLCGPFRRLNLSNYPVK